MNLSTTISNYLTGSIPNCFSLSLIILIAFGKPKLVPRLTAFIILAPYEKETEMSSKPLLRLGEFSFYLELAAD